MRFCSICAHDTVGFVFPSWVQLKLTAGTNFHNQLMVLWCELLHISSSISFADRKDVIVLKMPSSGIGVPSFIGQLQAEIPTRFHVFLLLLSPNRLLTRDSVANRQIIISDKTSLFGAISHLLSECSLAKLWLSEIS